MVAITPVAIQTIIRETTLRRLVRMLCSITGGVTERKASHAAFENEKKMPRHETVITRVHIRIFEIFKLGRLRVVKSLR